MTPQERFMAKVRITESCWVWTGAVNHKGYGTFWLNGRCQSAHRVSYMLFVGDIPSGMHLDHQSCFRHDCVRPDHLRLATTKQNAENRRGAQANNLSTGIRGVYPASSGRWKGIVTHNQQQYYLGTFDTIEAADDAVRTKRLELFTHNELDRTAI